MCLPTRQGEPHGQTESGGRVLAVKAGARAPRGGVTWQGVVIPDLQSLLDCQQKLLSHTHSLSCSSVSHLPQQPAAPRVLGTAHHKGHFTFKACPISSGQQPTQACFDANRLRFISGHGANFDPNYPDRAYIPPAPPGTQAANGSGRWDYQYRFQLPAGLSGDRVLLQWYYMTANSCTPDGYDRYNFPSGWHPGNLGACEYIPSDGENYPGSGRRLPEQFWNCAEVR